MLNKPDFVRVDDTVLSEPTAPTLESIIATLEAWRAKKKRGERIPEAIWRDIIIVSQTVPSAKLCRIAGISQKQFRDKIADLNATKSQNNAKNTDIPPQDISSAVPIYKPNKAFSTSTAVIELYGQDNRIMKVHLCTDRLIEAFEAFYKLSNASA